MSIAPHIVLAGEGGYSHLLSGLALADAVAECIPDAAITFVGSGRAIERHTVRERGYAYLSVLSQPSPHGPFEALRFMAENFVGYWAARWILREQQVSLVIGYGGPPSGIMVRAAAARGLPTVVLEQNAVPSKPSRSLTSSITCICTAFAETASLLPTNAPVQLTGFPVPAAIAELADIMPAACRPDPLQPRRLVILGGNIGASSFSQAMPAALHRLRHRLEGWHIVHQTGPGQLQAMEERYQSLGIDALAVSFIDELAHVLRETDLVVCRPGGTTLAELAVAGVPALLLPHPDAADDYQLANAQVYVTAGAARMIDERTCEDHLEEALAGQLELLLSDTDTRAGMATAIRNFSRPNAAEEIALLTAQLLSAETEILAAAA